MKSLKDLEALRLKAQEQTRLRAGSQSVKITIGMGTCGIAAGARQTLGAIMEELAMRNLGEVVVTQTGCIGLCDQEPLVEVEKAGSPKVTYGRVDSERARQIVARHVVNDQIIGEWVIARQAGS
ncbi:MAG: (2Fe-2S) ferredoxin domain-containing protein [Bacillota bacterium]